MDKKLLDKLFFKETETNLIVEIPEDVRDKFTGANFVEETWDAATMLDFALCFCEGIASVEFWFPRIEAAMKPDAKLWFAYPKKSSGVDSDINRDEGWDILTKNGFKPVASVSIDDTWSVLRFRRSSFVGR